MCYLVDRKCSFPIVSGPAFGARIDPMRISSKPAKSPVECTNRSERAPQVLLCRLAGFIVALMSRSHDRGVPFPSANAETCASLRRRMLTLSPPRRTSVADTPRWMHRRRDYLGICPANSSRQIPCTAFRSSCRDLRWCECVRIT